MFVIITAVSGQSKVLSIPSCGTQLYFGTYCGQRLAVETLPNLA